VFYLPLDTSTRAVAAAGAADRLQAVAKESILTLVEQGRPRFFAGQVGQAYDPGGTPLLYPSTGNFSPTAGALSLWIGPQFRGDDKNLYCIFFSAGPWGMLYKYTSHSSLTFATAKPDGDWYYNCAAPDISTWRPGQWRHVVLCWSRAENFRALYLDGRRQSRAPFAYVADSHGAPLVLGGGSEKFSAHTAHARLDEVVLWDRPLTDADVARLFALGQQHQPLAAAPAAPADADAELRFAGPLPCPATAASLEHPTATRERLSLDGRWAFLPAERSLETLPSQGWAQATVPGIWTARDVVRTPEGRSTGGRWQGRRLSDYPVAYYARRFTLPAGWTGRSVLLHVDGVDGLADWYLNRKLLGRLPAWEPADYRLTALRPGENEIVVRLRVRHECHSPGLYGSVYVEAREPAFLHDLVVQPSVARGVIGFSLDAWNASVGGPLQVEFDVLRDGGQGPLEKRFTCRPTIVVRPGAEGELFGQLTRVNCDFPWPDAHFWTYDDPVLYAVRARLYAGNRLLDETPPTRFGFREFTRRGSELLLNGKPTHLRGHQVDLHEQDPLERLRQCNLAGMNAFECLGPIGFGWYHGTPYRLRQYEELLDYADQNGMVAIPLLPDLWEIRERIFEPDVARLYRRRLEKHLRRFGNHASIGLWYMHFNLAGYHWYNCPTKIDGSYKPNNERFQSRERFALEAQRIYQTLDRRPMFHHACGNFSDMFTLNCYLGPSCPLAEREQWPLRWAARRPFPLLACEHCMMLIPYWYRPRQFPLSVVYADEPIFDEISAMYLGRRAYQGLSAELFDRYDLDRRPRPDRREVLIRGHRGYQAVKALFARYSLRAWRTFGVSAIVFNAIAWDFFDAAGKPLPVLDALARYFGDTDLYLAGPGGDWILKDHAFYAGEPVRKQVVLINDLTHDLTTTLAWDVQDAAGKCYASGRIDALVRAGVPTMYPIEFTVPPVEARTALRLSVGPAETDPHFQVDRLTLEIFPRPVPTASRGRLLVFDPPGHTRAAFRRSGVAFAPLTATSHLAAADAVIVGREAYGPEFRELAQRLKLEPAVAAGLNLLVFEQSAPTVFGLTVHEQSTRHVFPAAPGHPFLAGLEAADLINLRGTSDLIEPYPEAPAETEHRWPERYFKWGNHNVVATRVYRKPHYAPWVPVLECGFDLCDSPLLEQRIGRGRIVLCQLDVTARVAVDPVATHLVGTLLTELSHRGQQPLAPCLCVGRAAEAFVRPFGIQPASGPASAPRLLLVGPGPLAPAQAASLLTAAQNGATVVLLPGCPLAAASGLQLRPTRLFAAAPGPDPLLRGLCDGDFFLKRWAELPCAVGGDGWQLLTEPGVIAVKPLGRGRLIACQLDPQRCGDRGRIKALRVWNVLLAQLGADRTGWSHFLASETKPYEPNPWEQMPPYINW
jgi:hypothetical protein